MVETATSSAICLCQSRLFVDHSRWAVTILAPLDPLRGNRNRQGAKYRGASSEARRAIYRAMSEIFGRKYPPREAYRPNKHCPVRPITGHGRSCVYKWPRRPISVHIGIGLIPRNSREGGSLAPPPITPLSPPSHISGKFCDNSFCVILQKKQRKHNLLGRVNKYCYFFW